MKLSDLLDPTLIVLGARAADKSQALGDIARRMATRLPLPADTILEALSARERLGSTGFGRGFALPHVRLPEVTAPLGLLVRLTRPIQFEAIDGQPVDVLFALMMPVAAADGTVAPLAAVSRHMRDEQNLRSIRAAKSPEALFTLLQAAG